MYRMLSLVVSGWIAVAALSVTASAAPAMQSTTQPASIDIGSRLELFVDGHIVDKLENARHELHRPQPAGEVMRFDRPYEGPSVGYVTVIQDDRLYRMYYRGVVIKDLAKPWEPSPSYTCYAESLDGIHWVKPDLGIVEFAGSKTNNLILADDDICHNFAPFLDANPKADAAQRFKGVGGNMGVGLFAMASADGVHWSKLADKPVFTEGKFDSQNLVFWSEHEGCYVCYFRVFKQVGDTSYRWISRTTSPDFMNWSEPVEMVVEGATEPEQYYTNQTDPYFRAPHIYLATPARFMPKRRVVPPHLEKKAGVLRGYADDCSDGVFMSSRGGNTYQRLFMEAFVLPGPGLGNWVSRTNYPARGIVPTGPGEMSIYVQRGYMTTSHHLERLRLRTDGIVSIRADFDGGEMVTRPLIFAGHLLILNFATSAAGHIRVELQHADGTPLPGFAESDFDQLVGDDIERPVSWNGNYDVAPLAGKPIRVRFVMKDADLYSIRFR